jgi:LysM repeat protein
MQPSTLDADVDGEGMRHCNCREASPGLFPSMHPDLKVGLALAMLIVGFAGAMCFRHRPMDTAALNDSLPSDAALDAELELLPVRTYSPEQETADSEDGVVAPDEAAEILPTSNGELEIPEPITSAEDSESVVSSDDASQTVDATPADVTATYVVRSGDTLSGIASRLLGSTQRYEEIFEANRHQLNSPDDLHPGMELVIPPKVAPVESAPAGEPPSSDATSERAEPAQEPTPATVQRFTPIVPR